MYPAFKEVPIWDIQMFTVITVIIMRVGTIQKIRTFIASVVSKSFVQTFTLPRIMDLTHYLWVFDPLFIDYKRNKFCEEFLQKYLMTFLFSWL